MTLQYGNNGNDVKLLQQKLIDAGYDLGSAGADGRYGDHTRQAVEQYQRQNGLTVDGIAGTDTLNHMGIGGAGSQSGGASAGLSNNTWNNVAGGVNALASGGLAGLAGWGTNAVLTAAGVPMPAAQAIGALANAYASRRLNTFQNDFNDYGLFGGLGMQLLEGTGLGIPIAWAIRQNTQNEKQHKLDALDAEKPTYTNSYEDQLNELYDQIANREKFAYDVNSDALYKQYADIYSQNGQTAMEDTMGQAVGLTGGYGSSYAQNAGQQAYNGYMQQLNNVVPELEMRAYNRWQDEGNDLLTQYQLLNNKAAEEYAQYSDDWQRWYNERQYQANLTLSQQEAERQQANLDREYQMQQQQWEYQMQQQQLAQQLAQQQYQDALRGDWYSNYLAGLKAGDQNGATYWGNQLGFADTTIPVQYQANYSPGYTPGRSQNPTVSQNNTNGDTKVSPFGMQAARMLKSKPYATNESIMQGLAQQGYTSDQIDAIMNQLEQEG